MTAPLAARSDGWELDLDALGVGPSVGLDDVGLAILGEDQTLLLACETLHRGLEDGWRVVVIAKKFALDKASFVYKFEKANALKRWFDPTQIVVHVCKGRPSEVVRVGEQPSSHSKVVIILAVDTKLGLEPNAEAWRKHLSESSILPDGVHPIGAAFPNEAWAGPYFAAKAKTAKAHTELAQMMHSALNGGRTHADCC